MKSRDIVAYGLLIGLAGFLSISIFNIYRNQIELQKNFCKKIELLQNNRDAKSDGLIERVYRQGRPWVDIQKKVRDAVVQVFVQQLEFDWLQPYKTPSQSQGYGSGFFINDKGEIATSASLLLQAKAVWIQLPSLGKKMIDVDVVGLSPERNLALLKVKPEGLEEIKRVLGKIPYLRWGDSDLSKRADEVMALGYPLGEESLKSTTGVISGYQDGMIQISAAINPGSYGGPLLNAGGEVIGINTSSIITAQNVGYMIPINVFRTILPGLRSVKLLRKPFLGIFFCNGSRDLAKALGNPDSGGAYIIDIWKNSPIAKAGVKPGDVIYEIDGYKVDFYGETNVPWMEDKINLSQYIARLPLGARINLVIYRKGQRKEIGLNFDQSELVPVRIVYPEYEEVKYEVIAGIVFMPLTKNNLALLVNQVPTLIKYSEPENQTEPALIITHILPDSLAQRSRTLFAGAIVKEVNDMQVKTIDELRKALFKSIKTGFLFIKTSDNIPIAFSIKDVLTFEPRLSRIYKYPISDTVQELISRLKNEEKI